MSRPYFTSLDPPYVLADDATRFVFVGWAEVADGAAPAIELRINGRQTPVLLTERPEVMNKIPLVKAAKGVVAEVDFTTILAGVDPTHDPRGFAVEAELKSDDFTRVFEYAVSDAWVQTVFGRSARARRIPPAHLQIRVAGAAAGAFTQTAQAEASRIEALFAEAGAPLAAGQAVLDFGRGGGDGRPARLLSAGLPHPRLRPPRMVAWVRGVAAGAA